MKKLYLVTMVVSGVVLGGCTPYAVQDLAQQTRAAMGHMGEVHQQDLLSLANYDRERITQFQSLLSAYMSLRDDILSMANEALDKSKRASLAELDRAFDRRVEQIIAIDFWCKFRDQVSVTLGPALLVSSEGANAQNFAATTFANDVTQRNKAFLDARKNYLLAACYYQTADSSFATLIHKVDDARAKFRTDNETLFSAIPPLTLPNLPASVTNLSLTDNHVEIEARLATLRAAYSNLDSAQASLGKYFAESNPSADFFISAGKALVGVGNVAGVSTNFSAVNPTNSPSVQIPGKTGLLDMLKDKFTQVGQTNLFATCSLSNVVSGLTSDLNQIIARQPSTQSPSVIGGPASPQANTK